MAIKKLDATDESTGECSLAIEGDMTIYTAEELYAELKTYVEKFKKFDLSLDGVEDIDTTGVQMLLALKRHTDTQSDGALTLSSPSDAVREILELFNITERLEVATA